MKLEELSHSMDQYLQLSILELSNQEGPAYKNKTAKGLFNIARKYQKELKKNQGKLTDRQKGIIFNLYGLFYNDLAETVEKIIHRKR